MAVVFIIGSDWTMRTAVRAELREIGIDALGFDSAADVGGATSAGVFPDVVVLEATPELVGDMRINALVQHVPTVLIASRTVRVSFPDVAAVLYRPVRVAEIVTRVRELLAGTHAA